MTPAQSRLQELRAKSTWRRERPQQQLVEEWKDFKPNMEVPLFHTTVILNKCHSVRALIDDGCSGYATINEKFAQNLRLPMVPIEKRRMTGVLDDNNTTIQTVTKFCLDVAGLYTPKAWAYVVPGQVEEIILGKPWLKTHGAVINASKSFISFDYNNIKIMSDEESLRDPESARNKMNVVQIAASTFAGLARRSKRNTTDVQIFAASLADIDKALRLKAQPTLAQVAAQLPKYYREFAAVFDLKEAAKLPPHRPGMDHEIPLEKGEQGRDKEVPWGPLYNMSHDELLVLRKELTSLLNKKFIQESKSPAAAPVLFARKPGGGLRFCVDYRKLNAITRKDRYPLPLIRETLAALSKAKWLTKLDVSSAFHRIRMAKGEEWKTAFRTRYGLYEWNVCPFGLTGSPATFQRYINWTLREYLDDFCSAYVDDILIFSNGSLSDHRDKVKRVLQRLMENGLQLDISKCEFETKETKYLGYIIEAGKGIKMDPEKVKAIREWELPTTVKGLRSFLGFANYYRLFIKNYADKTKPLNDLTKKDRPFVWEAAQQQAFEELKRKFTEEPVLATYDPERRTRLETDASGWACGGVLSQFNSIAKIWKPIAFFSSRHSPAECNYDIYDKELLAIVKCIREWNGELRGLTKPFTVLTDHKNLEPFMEKKQLNERQVRWTEFLSHFQFKLDHRPGSAATIPDALSRREQDKPEGMDDTRLTERQRILLPKTLWVHRSSTENTGAPLPCPFRDDPKLQELWQQAMRDAGERYKKAYRQVQEQRRNFDPELELRLATGECDIENGLLRYRERLWLPNYEPLTTRVIQTVHDSCISGHPGRDTTIALVARRFFWPGMNQEVRKFLKNCHTCGRTTIWRDKKKGLLKPLPIPERVWQEISMDFITELPPSIENKCTVLLVITDRLGKGTMLIPIQPGKMDAQSIAKVFVHEFVANHWIPKGIVSDRGPQFVNAFWKEVCKLLNITQRLSTAYHPETDGATERRNQEVETYLRAFVSYQQSDWVDWLAVAQIALNNRPASTTGISPFFLTHGYNADPIVVDATGESDQPSRNPQEAGRKIVQKLKDAQEQAQAAMAVAQQRQEHYANQKRDPSQTFHVGDKVWLNLKNIRTDRPSKKLDWIHAKYTIVRTFPGSPHFYELDVPRRVHNKFHTSLLRLASNDPLPSQRTDDPQPPAILTDEGDEEFGVEKILRARTKRVGRGQRREILVKWIGYRELTWEPLRNFQDNSAIDAFEERYGDVNTHDGPSEEEGG